MHEKVAYRSRIAYAHLVVVIALCAVTSLISGSAEAGGIMAAVGLVWVLLMRRSGIEVIDDGIKVRGLLRTRHLDWSQADAFIVVGYSGEAGYFGSGTTGDGYTGVTITGGTDGSPDAVTKFAIANREHMLSLIAVVTDHGHRIKVPGTGSSFLDTTFPGRAAAELNRTLKSHNPAATAS